MRRLSILIIDADEYVDRIDRQELYKANLVVQEAFPKSQEGLYNVIKCRHAEVPGRIHREILIDIIASELKQLLTRENPSIE